MKKYLITAAATALLALAATLPVAADAATAKSHNIVLVHGAFAEPSSWDKVARILRHKGFHVTEVANPLTSLDDDVAATKAVLDAQDGPTVLVGHSWAGVVIGEAGDNPKVSALVYIAAFAPDTGETLAALSANGPTPAGMKAIRPDAKGFLTVDPEQFPTVFAGDVPLAEAKVMAAHQLPLNGAVFTVPAKLAAWHLKPDYYAVSANDQMIPPDAEAFFAKRMKATTITLGSSHAAMVSHPKEVAALIEQAAEAN
jgi:pimeloyl-ACP methyl ester carboxylesterase